MRKSERYSGESHELVLLCFFFNDTATTEIYTLSLHDALPISGGTRCRRDMANPAENRPGGHLPGRRCSLGYSGHRHHQPEGDILIPF